MHCFSAFLLSLHQKYKDYGYPFKPVMESLATVIGVSRNALKN